MQIDRMFGYLRETREKAGLSQTELSIKTGVSVRIISNIETEKLVPSQSRVRRNLLKFIKGNL